MKEVIEAVKRLNGFDRLLQQTKTPGAVQVSGISRARESLVVYASGEHKNCRIVISYSEQRARELMADYRFYDKSCVYYPAKDFLFYQANLKGNEIEKERMQVYKSINENGNITIFTVMDAFMDGLMPKEQMTKTVLRLNSGDICDIEKLKTTLANMGYERGYQVEGEGEFAVRGGIVDIYPLTEEIAYRIEFFDDEIDSIRSFEPASQRSVENVESVEIYPSESSSVGGEKSFFDYFDEKNTEIYIDDAAKCFALCAQTREEVEESRSRRKERGDELFDLTFFSEDDIKEKLGKFSAINFCPLDNVSAELDIKEVFNFNMTDAGPYVGKFDILVEDLKAYKRKGFKVLFTSASKLRAGRIARDLSEYDLNAFYSEDKDHEIKDGEIMVIGGTLSQGVELSESAFAIITDSDVFGREKKKRRRKKVSGETISSFTDLEVNDYVVHENHGLGQYKGIERIEAGGVTKDYIKIAYAKGGNLYMQITQLNLLQKYSGADGPKPRLNSLGSKEWQKTKTRVRESVDEIAQELVELYAVRQQKEGYVYGPDTVWQKEFEEMFPYEETDDQIVAIDAVKRDMESTKIMDRLICGDVGFGKTEVAIRAAFKAVQEGKQVVYLVPTTILAEQHYHTFAERMKDFPVTVELLCRFRTAAQQKKTIENLKKGMADIVIGTHRLLSDDVAYKNLGLLIIDEEQRFGVNHKEKIKQLKNNIDVLSLSATPIPRTLHMSLIGIRDMSVLEEAPLDRQPVQTFVMEHDDETVREAVSRELRRGGQVYYVYNNVRTIADVAARVEKLVPGARVSYAHGQMKENTLEDIMYGFINGEIDVLVSTTIVETGLDISNVNTMIIDDADKFGLSQLYQLRGRVGRSNRTAYAFLMYKPGKLLKEVAEKRLGAIKEYTELGSGIRIAMRDLEIRGAGNILGKSQSGNMEAVGYDLYCKMLNEAVRLKKGEVPEESFETTVDISVDAYIPAGYITNEFNKIDMYKRIAAIENPSDREEIEDELIDRFGDIPAAVQTLLKVAEIKALAHDVYVENMKEGTNKLRLEMYKKARIDPAKIPEFIKAHKGKLYFTAVPVPAFDLAINPKMKKRELPDYILEFLKDMREILVDTL
ncbi:MAG: transcription-repair coupling factor [Eubacterium sp.]|nr:transcription-repair coupling factor [Eubacterium sp.]